MSPQEKELIISYCKLLSLLEDNEYATILSNDELNSKIAMKESAILEYHLNNVSKIWRANDHRYKTFVYHDNGAKKLIAKTKEEDLKREIISFYKEKIKKPDTLASIYDDWFAYKLLDSSKANAHKLAWAYKKYYKNTNIVNKNLTKLRMIDMKTFFLQTITAFSLSNRQYKEMKSIANSMLDYAVEINLVDKNVARQVRNINQNKFRQEEKKNPSTEVFSKHELSILIQYAENLYEESKEVKYLAICLNSFLALRVAELVSLRFSDLINDNYIHIQRQEIKCYNQDENGELHRDGYEIAEHLKSADSDRILFLTSQARSYIKQIKEHSEKYTSQSSPYMFLNEDGERIHNDVINNALRKLCDDLGIQRRSNHKVRKTTISRLGEARAVEDDEIRRFAGHKYFSTTENSYMFTIQDSEIISSNFEKSLQL